MKEDLYQTLGVGAAASPVELRKAYRKLAMKYHPDKHRESSEALRSAAERQFKDITQAYEVLSRPETRRAYDEANQPEQKSASAPRGHGESDPLHMFGKSANMNPSMAQEILKAFLTSAGNLGAYRTSYHAGTAAGDRGTSCSKGRRQGPVAAGTRGYQVVPPGAVVKISGLRMSQYNGSIGRVQAFEKERQRYQVTLECGSTLSVLPQNVQQVLSQVRVIGTPQSDMSGKLASSTVYDAARKRYLVEGIAGTGNAVELKAENVVLPVQTRVRVEGLKNRPALNGRIGKINDVDIGSLKYVVQLGNDEFIRIRHDAVAAL
mmetsp:Transcript_26132/g.54887  ORF Transcript_26132/g.54887 Transcript_26132/m.54887 type:complete len:320 (-) Transcript_26132:206-1165(-)